MKNDEQLFDEIENYLQGKLPVEEAKAFELKIAADPQLAELVELYRFEQEGLEFLLQDKLRTKIKSWDISPPEDMLPLTSQKPPSGKWKPWVGLLTVLLILVAGFFVLRIPGASNDKKPAPPVIDSLNSEQLEPTTPNLLPGTQKPAEKKAPETPSTPQVYNKYMAMSESAYEATEATGSVIRSTSGTPTENILSPAFKALGKNPPDYPNAIMILEKIDPQQHSGVYDLAREMLAHTYYKTKQFDKAAAIFKWLSERKISATIQDRAEWYRLLSLLPDYVHQKEAIDNLLNKMIAPENYHEYRESALKLKESIAQ